MAAGVSPLVLDADHAPTAAEAATRLPEWLARALPAALPDCRWFGDKDRGVRSVRVVDLAVDPDDGGWFAWARLSVEFERGPLADYGIPLASQAGRADDAYVVVETPSGAFSVVDGVASDRFPAWWCRRQLAGGALAARHGRLEFVPLPGLARREAALAAEPGRSLAAEQSNTNLRYGDTMVAKIFRRLEPGLNPDVETSTRLWQAGGFRAMPEPLATVAYRDAEPWTVGFSQAFVANRGDGWAWVLDGLREVAGGGDAAPLVAAVGTLGERTAQMHAALAACGDDAPFAPEPVDAVAGGALVASASENLGRTLGALREFGPTLAAADRDAADRAVAAEGQLRERLDGFRALVGTVAVRVHGDFHLGQVLRTTEDDWAILDFEGEPARPMAERRRKQSVLKDVGGLLRSLDYARGATVAAMPDGSAALADWLVAARTAFLGAYRSTLAATGGVPLVPADDVAFGRALDAWVLDKALYEVRYELANRPAWVGLPLGALLRDPAEP